MSVTAWFKMDGVGSLTFTEKIEPLSEDDLNERERALAEIREKIIAAKRDLASGAYTSESVQALKDVIYEVNALFDDDSTTAEDVRAAEAKLLEACRCLEFDNSPADEDKQKWRDAVRFEMQ